jgi:cystathionine beta-lyase
MLDGMHLFRLGWSWGGFESLIIRANVERASYYHTPIAKRTLPWHAAGPYLRLHVGLEHADDLIADLEEGFARLRG